MNFNRPLKLFVVFLIIFAWIFSGWPQIWPLGELGVNKIRIPPAIQEAKASPGVEFVAKTEVQVDAGTSITMQIPALASAGDLLIAYISKDDNVAILTTGDYANWTMLYNDIQNSQSTLYIAWRIATADDVSGAVSWTWNGDNEDWLGEILCYSGANTTTPIHASGIDFLDSSNAPTAPSVAFTNLTAGSLVLQVFGTDNDNYAYYKIPAQLTERFRMGTPTDTGGAGGEKVPEWVSPTGFVDPDTVWTDEVKAYDNDFDTWAYSPTPTKSWSSYLELTIASISCSKVRFYTSYTADIQSSISLDVYYSGAWHNLYEGAYTTNAWIEKEIGSTQDVTAMRVKFYNNDTVSRNLALKEANFWNTATTGNTGTAVFGMDVSDEWTAVTLVIEAALTVINIAAIPGVTAPVKDATPVTTITETAQYTGTVTWDPAHNPFQGSTVYTATITLTPKAGFTLTGVAADFFTVAGATTVTNAANSGVVTAVFPETAAGGTISVSVSDGVITYGTLLQNSTSSTATMSPVDTQTLTNDGDVAETFNIKGSTSTNWTLGATAGSDIYVHKFCTSTCDSPPTNYTALTLDYVTLATNIATSSTTTVDLMINTPNPSTVFATQTVDVIVQAVEYP